MDDRYAIHSNPLIPIQELALDNREILLEVRELLRKLIGEKKETYLSPEEARYIFKPKISKPTLYRWTKSGLLKRHIIGGRVCYKLSEIEEAAKTNQEYKAKCPVETGQILQ